jgi:hypothetical protein
MPPIIIHKECLTCQKTLRGRSDKKFCNDYCRNVYNNNLKSEPASLVRKINSALLKNRKILLAFLNENQTMKVRREQLADFGFRFQFITHKYKSYRGACYNFCYETGYLELEDGWILVVRKKETAPIA